MMTKRLVAPLAAAWLVACASVPPQPPGAGHLRAERFGAGEAAAQPSVPRLPPPPVAPPRLPQTETYSVVVHDVRVHELLFALARDAKLNVDIHPGIEGTVTLNAIDQTLEQLLTRIARQVHLRWEFDGASLAVMPDTPFLRLYRIDYVNMARDTSGSVAVTTQIASTAAGGGIAGAAGNNNSMTRIENKAQNRFWETLEKNVRDILHAADTALPTGSLIVNPEAGIVSVRATARQHEQIREFLDQVMAAARRQVLIEATVAEITLAQNYQQGIDWSRVGSGLASTGLKFAQTGAAPAGVGLFTLAANQTTASGGAFSATLRLLEDYGTVKILSSPKMSVLNNQTAILKVVDNLAYFTIKSDTATSNTSTTTTYTTNLYSVPVGLVMNVTPQIGADDSVLLNIRPSISRKYGAVVDPHPELQRLNIRNEVPVIRTREMESILRIDNGNIAVMGGLMEDGINNSDQAVPWLSELPVLGGLFQNRNDTRSKTELVIFLRPVVIREAGIQGDYSAYRTMMPDAGFFERDVWAPPRQQPDFGSEAR